MKAITTHGKLHTGINPKLAEAIDEELFSTGTLTQENILLKKELAEVKKKLKLVEDECELWKTKFMGTV